MEVNAIPCHRCGGQYRTTYGEISCLQCGHPTVVAQPADRCHECGAPVAKSRALCRKCAARIWKPRTHEKAETAQKRTISPPGRDAGSPVRPLKGLGTNNPPPGGEKGLSVAQGRECAAFPAVSKPRKRRGRPLKGRHLQMALL